MKYLEYLQKYDNFDKYLLFLDELGFSGEEIATMTGVSRQTVQNAKKRQEELREALKLVKTIPANYGDSDVNLIVDTFKEAFGTTKTSKWDRFAAHRLAQKHGAENIAAIIKALKAFSEDRYAPSINSVRQLEEKWVNVENFLKRVQGSAPIEL